MTSPSSSGDEQNLEFKMQLDTVTETVVVVGESTQLINASRTGATSNVNQEALETLPTVNRGLEDFARTNPLFSVVVDQRPGGFHQRGRPQQPLQQHPDRRRGQQRSLRSRRVRHPRRPDRVAADQPRRGAGAAAPGVALRRPPGRLLRWRREPRHQERLQGFQRFGLRLLPRPGPGRRRCQRPCFRRLRGEPVRPHPRRSARQRQGLLLRFG